MSAHRDRALRIWAASSRSRRRRSAGTRSSARERTACRTRWIWHRSAARTSPGPRRGCTLQAGARSRLHRHHRHSPSQQDLQTRAGPSGRPHRRADAAAAAERPASRRRSSVPKALRPALSDLLRVIRYSGSFIINAAIKCANEPLNSNIQTLPLIENSVQFTIHNRIRKTETEERWQTESVVGVGVQRRHVPYANRPVESPTEDLFAILIEDTRKNWSPMPSKCVDGLHVHSSAPSIMRHYQVRIPLKTFNIKWTVDVFNLDYHCFKTKTSTSTNTFC